MCSFIWCPEGPIGLAVVGGVAVEAGDLVDTLDIVASVRQGGLARTQRGSLSACYRLSCCPSIFLRGLEREGWQGREMEIRKRVVSRLSGGGLSSEGIEEFSSTSSMMEVIC